MGTADILILAFILFFAVRGIIRGFIIEVIGLLGIVLAFLCSFMVYTPMLKIATAVGLSGNSASIAAYIIGFIIVYVIIIVLGNLIHKAISLIRLGWLNRLTGFVFGGLKGAAIASVVLWGIIYALPKDTKLIQDINKSPVAIVVMDVAPYIYSKINNISGVDRVNPFN